MTKSVGGVPLGFVAGFVLGLGDYFILRRLSVTMLVAGRDVTLWVVLLFACNYGVFGAVIALLWRQRLSLRRQAALIERQYQRLVENETLAAVGRMSAGVAHAVRNPLSVIRSSAQMMARDLTGEEAEAARFICEEVDRLDGFVARVLDYSRRLAAQIEPIRWGELERRLAPVVGGDVELLEEDAGTYQIDLDLTVRLLTSLVENARASGDGVRIKVVAKAGGIEVADDGPGVAPEHREAIFEPFFTTRAKGTGLGLAMARKLARIQGWELELVDVGLGPNGRGSRFRLEPVRDASARQDRHEGLVG